MLKKKFIFFSLVAFLFACHPKNTVEPSKDVSSTYLNTSRLPSQFFEVNVGADTTLTTSGGMQVHIPAGAIEAQNIIVKLEIKEAFTVQQIITARLNTITKDGQPLASNGMFYINLAEGQQAKIVKDISIKTPSNEFNPKAQLYSGDKTADNKIVWNEPKNVLKNGDEEVTNFGKSLFQNNCSSCHKIDKDQTGPALLHITKRLPRKWLYNFTRNNYQLRASGDCYANNLSRKWNSTQMNLFPNLDEKSLKLLYDYIDQESNRIAPINVLDSILPMPDCLANRKKLDSLLEKKYLLIKDNNGKIANVQQVQPPDSSTMDYIGEPLKVRPNNYDAVYYQFDIKAFGWYNIDYLLKDQSGFVNSMLRIRLQNNFEAQINIFLLIPHKKIHQEGGKLTDENYYGFHNVDGTIPLPQNEDCIVYGIGESQGKAIFGKLLFKSAMSQTLNLQMKSFSKEEMNKELSTLTFNGFSIDSQPTKNYNEINIIDWTLKILRNGCDCAQRPPTDSFEIIINP